MAIPIISGRIRLPNDTVHTGPFLVQRKSGPMLNGSTLVGISLLRLTTDADGDFSTALHPGIYILDTLVSPYAGSPPHRVQFRVPNTAGELNFADLAFETAMPDPSFFGGDLPGAGGDVVTATTTTQGKVKIKAAEGDPVVANWSIFYGADGDPVVHRIVAGKLRQYHRNTVSGNYHELICTTLGGTVLLAPDQAGVAFGSLPGA